MADRRASQPPRGPRGYAAAPGSGPAGWTCGQCRACVPAGRGLRRAACARAPIGSTGTLFIDRASAACARFEAANA